VHVSQTIFRPPPSSSPAPSPSIASNNEIWQQKSQQRLPNDFLERERSVGEEIKRQFAGMESVVRHVRILPVIENREKNHIFSYKEVIVKERIWYFKLERYLLVVVTYARAWVYFMGARHSLFGFEQFSKNSEFFVGESLEYRSNYLPTQVLVL